MKDARVGAWVKVKAVKALGRTHVKSLFGSKARHVYVKGTIVARSPTLIVEWSKEDVSKVGLRTELSSVSLSDLREKAPENTASATTIPSFSSPSSAATSPKSYLHRPLLRRRRRHLCLVPPPVSPQLCYSPSSPPLSLHHLPVLGKRLSKPMG